MNAKRRKSTLVFNGQITMGGLRSMISAEKDISAAVRQLGYNPDKPRLSVGAVAYNRYSVCFGKSYVGIWDVQRKTFVN